MRKQLTRSRSFDLASESILVFYLPLARQDKWAGTNYRVDVGDERLMTRQLKIAHRKAYDR